MEVYRLCANPASQPEPATVADATAMARAGLAFLAPADTASLTTAEQADCLRALAQAESIHTAARARVLSAFTAQAGYEDDGHRSPRTWLSVADPGGRRRGSHRGQVDAAAGRPPRGRRRAGGGGGFGVVGAADL